MENGFIGLVMPNLDIALDYYSSYVRLEYWYMAYYFLLASLVR